MNTSLKRPVRELATTALDELRQRRAAASAHRELRRELASYQTPQEIDDLLGLIQNVEGPEAEQIRDILLSNLRPGTGYARVA